MPCTNHQIAPKFPKPITGTQVLEIKGTPIWVVLSNFFHESRRFFVTKTKLTRSLSISGLLAGTATKVARKFFGH